MSMRRGDSPARTRRTRRNVLLCLALSVVAPFVLYFAALVAAAPLLELKTPVVPVDVIVVLGGAGPSRAAKAAAVYQSIATANPRVLVSGDVDCVDIAKLMIEDGVPPDSIELECRSRNTWENAEFSAPLLKAMEARTAILVTSWFHMRRATACFKSFSPQIHWGAAPVEPRSLWEIAPEIEGVETVKEYLKVVWYAVRYGLLVY
jgi:uncharacterized SAM-binding protein YcdF (DUF218 family)